MVYTPREGAELDLAGGQPVFAFHTGALYVISGQVRYSLETKGEPFHYTLGAGELLGLEQPHLPPAMLSAKAFDKLQARAWSYKGLEMYVGKDLQFALCALLSLSRQQRHLNQELAQRWEAMDFDSAHRLAAMAEQNAQSGNADMAEVYYRRLVGTHPGYGMNEAIRAALSQFRKEQSGTGPLRLDAQSTDLSQETQLSLYQLAFGGIDGLNRDILERFGRVFQPGETLCTEGESGEELFLLLRGSVEVSRKSKLLGRLFGGDLVGEMAVLEGQIRSATVTALEETMTLALGREHFKMIFQLHPSWTWKLLQGFSLRLANAWQLLATGVPLSQQSQSQQNRNAGARS